MNPVSQNTTSQLAAALKEAQRLDSFEEKRQKEGLASARYRKSYRGLHERGCQTAPAG